MSERDGHRQRPARAPADDDEPVLPTSSPDDSDEAWGDEPRSGERDAEWYRRERPPHHE